MSLGRTIRPLGKNETSRILGRVTHRMHALAKSSAALAEIDLEDWVAQAIEDRLRREGRLEKSA